MSRFTIKTPSGKTLTIEAPDQATALQGAQDWESQNSPTGRAATDAAKRAGSSPNQVRSLANGATLGLANLVDAGGAAAETGFSNLLNPGAKRYGMGEAFNAVRNADNAQDRQFQQQHPIQATGLGLLGGLAMPGSAALGSFVKGSAPVAAAAKGLLPRVAQIAAQTAPVAARSAVVGAGLGGVAGAAGADPGQELQGATHGAATGGLTGAAVPVVGQSLGGISRSPVARMAIGGALGGAAGAVMTPGPFKMEGIAAGAAAGAGLARPRAGLRLASRVSSSLGGPTLNPQREAGMRLIEAMQRDGMPPDAVRTVANQWLQGGVTPTLMDAVNNNGGGQNTMALLRSAAMKSPSARNIFTAHDDQIGRDLSSKALTVTAALTPGDTATTQQAIAEREAARDAAAAAEYRAPYATQVPAQPIVPALTGPSGAKAAGAAYLTAEANKLDPAVAARLPELDALRAAANPEPSPNNAPPSPHTADLDPETAAWAKRMLGQQPPAEDQPLTASIGSIDQLKQAFNRMGADADANQQGLRARGYYSLGQNLDDHLAGQSPDYAAARGNFAARSAPIDAINLGASGLSPSTVPADYADSLRGLAQGVHPEADPAVAASSLEGVTSGVQTGLRAAAQQALGNDRIGAIGGINNLRRTNARAIFASTFDEDTARNYDSVLDKLSQQNANADSLNLNTGSQTGLLGEDGGWSLHPGKIFQHVVSGIKTGMLLTDGERQALAKMATAQAQPALSALPGPPEPNHTSSPALARILAPYAARQAASAQ